MKQYSRIEREKQTVALMIHIYCKHKHHPQSKLCDVCQELLDYALLRLDHCKFGENKTVCGDCPVHCYKKELRDKIISVMRYSGPRMLFYHPLAAVQHLIDIRRGIRHI